MNLNLPQEGAPEKKPLQRIAMYKKWANLIVLLTTICVICCPLIVNRYPLIVGVSVGVIYPENSGQGRKVSQGISFRH